MKETSLFILAAGIVMLGATVQAVGTVLELGWVRAIAGALMILALIVAQESGRRHR